MTARHVKLPDHLDLIATAPDGIRKLRGLILELAVRGKLVPQDPSDEPAGELLQRIEAERAQQVKTRQVRDSNAMKPIGDHEQPFEIPVGWAWVRIGSVVIESSAGWSPTCESRPRNDQEEWGVLKVSAVTWGSFDAGENKALPLHMEPRPEHEVRPGDFLVSRANTAELVARSVFVESCPAKLMLSDKIVRLKLASVVSGKYINLANSSLFARDYYAAVAGGTSSSMKNVSREQILQLPLPLPPLAEQHRIVVKVNELMALCDRLETEQTGAEDAHARLVETLLASLTRSTDAAELAANWQRLAGHFDTLLTTETAIDALKQTVLQLAVMGKLVPQYPNDEPVAQSSGKPSALPSIPLPRGWQQTSFAALCEIGGGMTPTKSQNDYWGEGLPWVSPKDMKVDFISDAQDHITAHALSETTIRPVPSGSLLVVVRGMILAHSFPVAITQIEVTINQDMKALTPRVPGFAPYLMLVCKGFKNEVLNLVERSSHGTCKLETRKLLDFTFGFPPLAEQHRIVAKVDELMALCDRLKADLATARQRQATLADTLIAAALEAA